MQGYRLTQRIDRVHGSPNGLQPTQSASSGASFHCELAVMPQPLHAWLRPPLLTQPLTSADAREIRRRLGREESTFLLTMW